MAKKTKQSKQIGGNKKSSKQKGSPATHGVSKPLILFAVILFSSVCFIYALEELLGPGTTIRYAASLVSGILAGFSGNPLWYALPAKLAPHFGLSTSSIACLPSGLLHQYFKPDISILFITLVMAASTAYDGIKKQRVRYEPAVLIPAIALPVMYLATQMRVNSENFYYLFKDLFSGQIPIGFIAGMLIILGIAKWAMRSDSGTGRHWSWSLAAGSIIGFWFGYLEYSWVNSLVVLLYFSYLFVMNEGILGMIYGLPLSALPLIAGKIIIEKSGAGPFMVKPDASFQWAQLLITIVGFGFAYLFSTRLMAALHSGIRRTLFFITLFVFLVSILLNV
jgi:hypothetical protein